MLEIKQMESQDLTAIIALCKEAFPTYTINEKVMSQVLFSDENYHKETCWVAKHKNNVLGFCFGIKRYLPYGTKGIQEGIGWILLMAVDKHVQRQGIGHQLLHQTELSLSCNQYTIGAYSPYYFLPGAIDQSCAFFQKCGYKRKEAAYRMKCALHQTIYPEKIKEKKQEIEKQGYTFSSFTWQDSQALLAFIKENFSYGWYVHVRQAIRSATATQTILLCKKDNCIKGYVQRACDGDQERYGPFGVQEELRNLGIGSVLVHDMWKSMQEHHLQHVWFHSTDNAGRRFYERNGMQITTLLYHMEKNI